TISNPRISRRCVSKTPQYKDPTRLYSGLMGQRMNKEQPIVSDPELQAVLDRFDRTIKANPRDDLFEAKPASAKIIQLPLWPEPVRGAPNTLLRSAFFAAIHSKGAKKSVSR